MKRFLSLVLASTAVFALSSCNKDESSNSAQQGSNSSATGEGSPNNDSDGTSPKKQSGGAEKSSKGKPNPTQGASAGGFHSDDSSADSKQPQQPAQSVTSQHNIHSGQVGGDCGTTNQGDRITAGSRTSCEMAAATFDAAINANYYAWTPDPTVTSIPRTNLSVRSPQTGKTYNLICTVDQSHRELSCREDTGNAVASMNSKPSLYMHYEPNSGGFGRRINITDHTRHIG